MGQPTVRIDGALVVLTGATGGLGGVLARAFDARGARLLLTGRRIDALEELASQLRHAEVLPCDMSDRHQVDALLERVEDADVLVANAALPAAGALDDFTVPELDRAFDVNLRTPMLLTQRAAPNMAARGGGHIVLISSVGAKVPASRAACKFPAAPPSVAQATILRDGRSGRATEPLNVADVGKSTLATVGADAPRQRRRLPVE